MVAPGADEVDDGAAHDGTTNADGEEEQMCGRELHEVRTNNCCDGSRCLQAATALDFAKWGQN